MGEIFLSQVLRTPNFQLCFLSLPSPHSKLLFSTKGSSPNIISSLKPSLIFLLYILSISYE